MKKIGITILAVAFTAVAGFTLFATLLRAIDNWFTFPHRDFDNWFTFRDRDFEQQRQNLHQHFPALTAEEKPYTAVKFVRGNDGCVYTVRHENLLIEARLEDDPWLNGAGPCDILPLG